MPIAPPASAPTESGGEGRTLPQQTTARVPDWIAQPAVSPTARAVAVPPTPFTVSGGVAFPSEPQQTTAPERSAHAYEPDAARALAPPSGSETTVGGVQGAGGWQKTLRRCPARMAQVRNPTLTALTASPGTIRSVGLNAFQQTKAWVIDCSAQICPRPVLTAVAVPLTPFTESGGG